MGLTIKTPPGYSDLSDTVLAAGSPALGIDLAKIYDNAVFGIARTEIFSGLYANGNTVPTPVSPIDGYPYSRSELLYFWTIRDSANPNGGWISAADSLFYCAWLVDQSTGIVYCDEWYRRSGSHANVTHTNDGKLQVWTIAQRGLTSLVMASSPSYSAISSTWIGQDKPLTQQLAQGLNDDAKFSVVNHEVFYLGEYYNGQTVTLPISAADGYHYAAAECKFLFSWRWTPPGNSSPMIQPALADGQLGPMQASVSSAGVVSTTIFYIDNNGNLISFNDGRIAVFAFCQRSGTPASITPTANAFAEIDFGLFMPGSNLPYTTVQQMLNNTLEALLTPEFFAPTIHQNGDTIPLPVSPVDGYAYSRSELYYLWTWTDTTNQTGTHLRVPLFLGHIDDTTGIVTINVWRLPPGGPYIDDNNTLCRISVITVARRAAQAPAPVTGSTGVSPQADYNVGGNQVVDIPTISTLSMTAATGTINGTNTSFTIPISATILAVFWNGVMSTNFTQSSPPSNSFTTGFTPNTGDLLYVLYYT